MTPHPFVIYLKNKTSQQFEYKSDIKHISYANQRYRITFRNGGSYSYGSGRVLYYRYKSTQENVGIYENGKLNETFDTVDDYGEYFIFRNTQIHSDPIHKSANIEIYNIKKVTNRDKSIISYFTDILKGANNTSFDIKTENKDVSTVSTDILLKALENVNISDPRSILSSYISGILPEGSSSNEVLLYPFGCNESQQLAVKSTLKNGISIIEGPPGTGKTQTILNIVTNIIAQKKTVAIVSNNNSAVYNVREKLEKHGYGMIIASLGNSKNKNSFFENLPEQVIDDEFSISNDRKMKAENEISNLDIILTKCFQHKNRLASLKTQLSDTQVEFKHIEAEQPLSKNIKLEIDSKFYRSWSPSKSLKFKALLSSINLNKKSSYITKLKLIISYGLLDIKNVHKYSDILPIYVNHKFYELTIKNLTKDIAKIERWLKSNNEKSNIDKFTKLSKEVFNGIIHEKYSNLATTKFTSKNYLTEFDVFIKHYPVVISSTLSLHSSIPKGYLFDYLIIDESSQVDIIKSAICFSCCRNVVVVGDSMQLSHIVDKDSQQVTKQLQAKYNIDSAYNYVEKNILNSLKSLYGDSVKSTLLKEHYRCHPIIIGFCNKKYYDNQLVIMTESNGHPFRIIETNISGCRDTYNQRQILETDLYVRKNYADDYNNVGIISPYRSHANLLQKQLPEGTESDTIHKYQGREKNVIIFNTVKNQINEFIDNPNLINVAVSRAINEFIVVKPESMELPHGTNIGDMIRYMCYTTDTDKTILKGKIRSVFDLLYKEYNKQFIAFISSNKNIKGSAAEVIIYKLLSKLLKSNEFSSIDFAQEYKLQDLVRDFQLLTEDEISYIDNNSRLDFLLYNKIDKSPILAIEVDGVAFHNDKLQRERDSKKNHIMEVIELPLLRLSTDGYNEYTQIVESLQNAMKSQ